MKTTFLSDPQYQDKDPRSESELLEDCAWARLQRFPWGVTPELLFAMKEHIAEEKGKQK